MSGHKQIGCHVKGRGTQTFTPQSKRFAQKYGKNKQTNKQTKSAKITEVENFKNKTIIPPALAGHEVIITNWAPVIYYSGTLI